MVDLSADLDSLNSANVVLQRTGRIEKHTNCTRAPFWPLPEPTVVSAEPFLRCSEDFWRFTTSWLEELKLSEAWRFMAGMLIAAIERA